MITESGKVDSRLADKFQYVFLAIYLDRNSIDGHIFSCFHQLASLTALKGQALTQAPHLMHLAESITKDSFIFPLIASTGQTREHFDQPLHKAGSMEICFSF
jgi:hypothetical protein